MFEWENSSETLIAGPVKTEAPSPVMPEKAGMMARRQADPATGFNETLMAKLPEETSTPETIVVALESDLV